MADKAPNERVRTTCRMDSDTYERVKYWAGRHGETVSEYLANAVVLRIAYDNHDFDLDDATVQRIGQLVEGQREVAERMEALEGVVTSAVRSLLQLTRGDNYLLDDIGDDRFLVGGDDYAGDGGE